MIDLGQAGEQKESVGNNGPIPPKSIVKVRMAVQKPKKADPQDPAVTIFSSGLKGLSCEFTVIGGTYDGLRIWENWFLPPTMQTIKLSSGQEGVCNGSFAKARAVIEAARSLDPEDMSANRSISSWFDLHGLEFPVRVGMDKPKPGDKYLNNTIAKVITMTDEHYKDVMGGGEWITDEKIPELPAGAAGGAADSGGAPQGWGGGQSEAPVREEPPLPPEPTNVPSWAK